MKVRSECSRKSALAPAKRWDRTVAKSDKCVKYQSAYHQEDAEAEAEY